MVLPFRSFYQEDDIAPQTKHAPRLIQDRELSLGFRTSTARVHPAFQPHHRASTRSAPLHARQFLDVLNTNIISYCAFDYRKTFKNHRPPVSTPSHLRLCRFTLSPSPSLCPFAVMGWLCSKSFHRMMNTVANRFFCNDTRADARSGPFIRTRARFHAVNGGNPSGNVSLAKGASSV